MTTSLFVHDKMGSNFKRYPVTRSEISLIGKKAKIIPVPGNELDGDRKETMRTTVDLIDELDSNAEGMFMAGLIVGFEERTEYVFSSESDQLGKLNALCKQGGNPVGIFCGQKEGSEMTLSLKPLQEFKDDNYLKSYLGRLKDGIIAFLRQQPGVLNVIYRPDLN